MRPLHAGIAGVTMTGPEDPADLPPGASLPSVRPVAAIFAALLSRGATRGYVELVAPATFEEQCAEQRLIRDLEDEP